MSKITFPVCKACDFKSMREDEFTYKFSPGFGEMIPDRLLRGCPRCGWTFVQKDLPQE